MKTHGSTHSDYKLQLLDVFECAKQGEATSPIGNKYANYLTLTIVCIEG